MFKLVSFIAVILGAAGLYFWSPFTTTETGVRASDQIMIENAIDYFLENRQTEQASVPGGGVNKYKIYESRNDFMEAFPDCCRFTENGTDGHDLSRRDRRISDFSGIVVIEAGQRRIDGDEVRVVPRLTSEIYMSTAGEIIPYLPRRV